MKREHIAIFILLASGIASADFYRPSAVPASLIPTGYSRGRAAAVNLVTDDVGCSGTIISKQGHVLTALHCLDRCASSKSDSTLKSFRYRAPDRAKIVAGTANCRVSVTQEGSSLGSLSGQVVAAGSGYVEFSDGQKITKELDGSAAKRDYFVTLMKAGVGIPGDFAIVYLPKLAGRTCAPVISRAPVVGESIWNIAYPIASSRPNGLGTPGGIAVFSSGSASWVQSTPPNYQVQTGAEASLLRINRPGILVARIDSNEGSSGSGLLTNNGELLAVLNSSSVSINEMSQSYNNQGGRNAATGSYIRQVVNANYGAAVANSAFNCY